MPSASTKLDEFFNVLRDTGTNLPFRNSQLCSLLRQALEQFDPNYFDILDPEADDLIPQEMIDQLAADLEVIEDALRYEEENPE